MLGKEPDLILPVSVVIESFNSPPHSRQSEIRRRRRSMLEWAWLCAALLLVAGGCKQGGSSGNSSTSLDPPGEVPAFPLLDHVDQADIAASRILFEELFILGDELFETQFNGLDGTGILRLPDGTDFPERFSRIPPGGGRFGGPNAQACEACHNQPFGTAAGEASTNVLQDPGMAGASPFNVRNPPSLLGSAVLQRLAEEMTEDLLAIRDAAEAATTPGGPTVTRALTAKGIDFGMIHATQDAMGTITFDTSDVDGVDPDLVVRPYGWKGNVTTLRDFTRGAASTELGMEADELVAKDPLGRDDPDGDGVEGELSVGDITALTIYVGAQEIPTTLAFLVASGFEPPPSADVAIAIARGEVLFTQIGCDDCHVPELQLVDPVFEEPTLRGDGNYFDTDIDPVATSLRADRPATLHLVREGDFPRLEPHPTAGARVALFGDLKRHNMGAHLADAQTTTSTTANGEPVMAGGGPVTIGTQMFLTTELWGVADTEPWLHDGRAATLTRAILLHGVDTPPAVGDPGRSEAQEVRDAFAALSADDQAALVEFLKSLRHFELEEGAE